MCLSHVVIFNSSVMAVICLKGLFQSKCVIGFDLKDTMAAAGHRAGTYCKPVALTPDGWFDTNECVTHSVGVLHTLQKMSTFIISLN